MDCSGVDDAAQHKNTTAKLYLRINFYGIRTEGGDEILMCKESR